MRLLKRNLVVQAFKLPLLGEIADDVPPKWLIDRLQSGDLDVNRLGGLSLMNRWGHQQCAAGDVVLLTDDDGIIFVTADEFAKFQPLSDTLPQAA